MTPSPLRRAAGPVGLGLLVGLALPAPWGLVPTIAAVALVAWGLLALRPPATGALDRCGAWQGRLPGQLGLAIAASVGARAVGRLLVDHPASCWAAGPLVLAAVLGPRLRGRARPAAFAILTVLVPLCGVLGARFEAGATDAHGYAHSGPILGIHPFQTTAVVVDGHGPFDLPINDFVEPDGSRGYSPDALAAAWTAALHRIAELHFADGPAQAHAAFARAQATFVETPAVRESLERELDPKPARRILVTSGGVGQRSRVEFVCPGQRNDPRPREPDNVLNRMCPDKYASEASAGLGLTGRWTGYVEGRGNERLGLSRLLGWTRSDDREGAAVREREIVVWALLVLALAYSGRTVGARARAGAVVELGGLAGLATVAIALALGLAAAATAGIAYGPWSGPGHTEGTAMLLPWVPLLLLAWATDGRRPPTGRRDLVALATVLGLATLALAAAPRAIPWAMPIESSGRTEVPIARFVEGLADVVARRFGLEVFTVEGAVAASALAAIAGLVLATAEIGAREQSAGATPPPPSWPIALGAAVLVLSRKTLGGSTLLPVALAMTLLSHVVLALEDRVRSTARRVALGGLVVVPVLVLLVETMRRVESVDGWLGGLFALAGIVALGALWPLFSAPGQRAGERVGPVETQQAPGYSRAPFAAPSSVADAEGENPS